MNIAIYTTLSINLLHFESCRTVSAEVKCFRSLSDGKKAWYCCDNYEDINGTCVACTDGYISDNGEACRPCTKGLYGRKCGEVCACEKFQECNHKEGCRNFSDVVTTATFYEDLSTPRLLLMSSINPDTNEGKLKTEIIIVICTCTICLLLIICMIWFRHYTKQRLLPEKGARNSGSKSTELGELKTLNACGMYDYIDESKICDLVRLPSIDQTQNRKEGDQLTNEFSDDDDDEDYSDDTENNNDETDKTLDDGYLKPYNMLKSSEANHRYSRTGVAGSRTSSDAVGRNTTDEVLQLASDEISSEKGQKDMSKYISIHEPDVLTVDVHCPISMHESVPDTQPTIDITSDIAFSLV
ncbi:uncharacterized protein LOC127714322 [Mytilus californianus]|uniref:uncharacterized protein LOC127714322 n=1 Tax=Mytilus californianus TaxID=6549 RepID=UPI002245153F|nr:uncharacterized protein LOC127714322 [Mytilus californianus]